MPSPYWENQTEGFNRGMGNIAQTMMQMPRIRAMQDYRNQMAQIQAAREQAYAGEAQARSGLIGAQTGKATAETDQLNNQIAATKQLSDYFTQHSKIENGRLVIDEPATGQIVGALTMAGKNMADATTGIKNIAGLSGTGGTGTSPKITSTDANLMTELPSKVIAMAKESNTIPAQPGVSPAAPYPLKIDPQDAAALTSEFQRRMNSGDNPMNAQNGAITNTFGQLLKIAPNIVTNKPAIAAQPSWHGVPFTGSVAQPAELGTNYFKVQPQGNIAGALQNQTTNAPTASPVPTQTTNSPAQSLPVKRMPWQPPQQIGFDPTNTPPELQSVLKEANNALTLGADYNAVTNRLSQQYGITFK